MIYTIGHKSNYEKAITANGAISKCRGGYAFESIADAERRIAEEGKSLEWCVWGIDANWDSDTEKAPEGWWHLLTKDAVIVPVS